MKKNKSKILIITIITLTSIIGVTYAAWILFFSQTNSSKIASTCFNITMTDKDDINLEKAYPLTDELGKRLTPYSFTITNKCNTTAAYQINLELINTSTITNMDYIKLMLDDNTPYVISMYSTTEKSLNNATNAYKISSGYLNSQESKTFKLRLWIDESVTMETEGIQNSTLEAKVTVKTNYIPEDAVPATAKITELAKTDTTNLATDDYGNIRYIGANPNNYVTIDGELWRIIGVMKNIENGTGQSETRVKLIRSESIGNYSWYSSEASVNEGWGINEWSEAHLMKLLNPGYEENKDTNSSGTKITVNNSLYYNSSSGTCFNYQSKATTSCDFTSTGMKKNLKNLIGNVVWNTGSVIWDSNTNVASKFYTEERGTRTGKICSGGDYCNDTVERTTSWTGLVGLMYPSDYGYATGGGKTLDRAACLNLPLHLWYTDGNANAKDCYGSDWLYNSDMWQWTLTPQANASISRYVFYVISYGRVDGTSASRAGRVRPVVYLSSNVTISGGDGTLENPYTLER